MKYRVQKYQSPYKLHLEVSKLSDFPFKKNFKAYVRSSHFLNRTYILTDTRKREITRIFLQIVVASSYSVYNDAFVTLTEWCSAEEHCHGVIAETFKWEHRMPSVRAEGERVLGMPSYWGPQCCKEVTSGW